MKGRLHSKIHKLHKSLVKSGEAKAYKQPKNRRRSKKKSSPKQTSPKPVEYLCYYCDKPLNSSTRQVCGKVNCATLMDLYE